MFVLFSYKTNDTHIVSINFNLCNCPYYTILFRYLMFLQKKVYLGTLVINSTYNLGDFCIFFNFCLLSLPTLCFRIIAHLRTCLVKEGNRLEQQNILVSCPLWRSNSALSIAVRSHSLKKLDRFIRVTSEWVRPIYLGNIAWENIKFFVSLFCFFDLI